MKISRTGRALALTLAAVVLLVVAGVVAAPSSAATTVSFNAKFTENLGGPRQSPFSCATGDLCGSGIAVGLGRFNESIVFGGGCGGDCDLRTITFSDGSALVLDENGHDPFCPGNNQCRSFSKGYGNPNGALLVDEVDGTLSTGVFAGASGTLNGQVVVAGAVAQLQLAGPITLA